MQDKIAICNPTNNRPQYYRSTLDTLSQCASRASFMLVTSEEPTSETLHSLLDKAREFIDIERSINAKKLGQVPNFFQCMSNGLRFSDRLMYVEDDHIFARDALNYILYIDQTFRDDPNCFGASCFSSNDHRPPLNYGNLCFRKSWFHAWGFFTWQERWEEYLKTKDKIVSKEKVDLGFDFALDDYVRKRGFYMVYPFISRVEHIGDEGVHKGKDKMINEGPRPFWYGSNAIDWQIFESFSCINGLYQNSLLDPASIPFESLWQLRIDDMEEFQTI